jgi:1,6-anhydro-N-acetylmuramate kinase
VGCTYRAFLPQRHGVAWLSIQQAQKRIMDRWLCGMRRAVRRFHAAIHALCRNQGLDVTDIGYFAGVHSQPVWCVISFLSTT